MSAVAVSTCVETSNAAAPTEITPATRAAVPPNNAPLSKPLTAPPSFPAHPCAMLSASFSPLLNSSVSTTRPTASVSRSSAIALWFCHFRSLVARHALLNSSKLCHQRLWFRGVAPPVDHEVARLHLLAFLRAIHIRDDSGQHCRLDIRARLTKRLGLIKGYPLHKFAVLNAFLKLRDRATECQS